jgi:hypothetical protein
MLTATIDPNKRSEVQVRQPRDGVVLVLKCESPQMAALIAKQVVEAVARFDTFCE